MEVDQSTDRHFMKLAIAEAVRAEQAGEVPVGAILVHNNQVIAAAHNRNIMDHDPGGHAEMCALRAAGSSLGNHRLPDTTIYVTLEPCVMCAGAMIHARIARLVFGASDPKTGAAGGRFNLLGDSQHNHSVQVHGGCLAEECSTLLRAFFRARR